VEQVHAWLVYRREVTHTSVRGLAAEIGISKSMVETFYKQKSHPARIWPKLRDWYMRTRNATPSGGYTTPPIIQLIGALELVESFPGPARARAMRALANWIRETAQAERVPLPRVVEMLEKADESTTPESIREKIRHLPASEVPDDWPLDAKESDG
jgi:hypothetical protein